MDDKNLKELKNIKSKESKYEKVLKLSSDELIAKAISDLLKKEEHNDNYKK